MMIALAMVMAVSAFAQEGKDIYNRYSGKEGVSAVYISPTMFSLMKKIPDIRIEVEEVNLGNIIRTFDGMYILDVENRELAAKLDSEIRDMVSRGRFELLIQAVEKGEEMNIYITREGDMVTDFLMLAREDGNTSVISITGKMPFDELQNILAQATE